MKPLCIYDMTVIHNYHIYLLYCLPLLIRWHLGFCQKACTPNERGFDTFFGLYGGMGDQYEHKSCKYSAQ